MNDPASLRSDDDLDRMIGGLLRSGVLLAGAVTIVGGALFLAHHGREPLALGVFRGEPVEYRSLDGIVTAARAGGTRALIQIGVVLLIATPISRVALMMVAFWRQRDRLFVAISALVLGLLLFSLLYGQT